MARPRLYHIQLSKKERKVIRQFQRKTKSANARTRCAILLAADPNGRREKTYDEIAIASGACIGTVIKVLGNTSKTAHPSRRDGMLFRFKRHDAG